MKLKICPSKWFRHFSEDWVPLSWYGPSPCIGRVIVLEQQSAATYIVCWVAADGCRLLCLSVWGCRTCVHCVMLFSLRWCSRQYRTTSVWSWSSCPTRRWHTLPPTLTPLCLFLPSLPSRATITLPSTSGTKSTVCNYCHLRLFLPSHSAFRHHYDNQCFNVL